MKKYYKRDSFEQGKSIFDCSLIATQQVNGKTRNWAVEKFLSMVEGTTSSEISNINQMDENLFKEYLQKNSVWDYEMYKGKSLYFVFLSVIRSLALTF